MRQDVPSSGSNGDRVSYTSALDSSGCKSLHRWASESIADPPADYEVAASSGEDVAAARETPPRLLAQVQGRIRRLGMSKRTEHAYLGWIKRYVRANQLRHPATLGAPEVEAFLTNLATRDQVAPATQNQALSALLFLYREVLSIELPWMDNVRRAKQTRRLPVVLTISEVRRVLDNLNGRAWLMASLLYGTGMRLMECVRLRVKDVSLARRQILVRDGKGSKDRITMLPSSLIEQLRVQMDEALRVHQRDVVNGGGETWLPHALARKYPNAAREPGWQYVFPAAELSTDPRSGITRRHHINEQLLQRAVNRAVRRAAIRQPASCHTFRHSFATHLLDSGYDIRTVASPAHPCARGIRTSVYSTGTAGAQRRENHADLHPRAVQGPECRAQPAGPRMTLDAAVGINRRACATTHESPGVLRVANGRTHRCRCGRL